MHTNILVTYAKSGLKRNSCQMGFIFILFFLAQMESKLNEKRKRGGRSVGKEVFVIWLNTNTLKRQKIMEGGERRKMKIYANRRFKLYIRTLLLF